MVNSETTEEEMSSTVQQVQHIYNEATNVTDEKHVRQEQDCCFN